MIIDPEIKALIPALKPDERAKLRESIKNEGCRDPLVLWTVPLEETWCRHCYQETTFSSAPDHWDDDYARWQCDKCGAVPYQTEIILLDGHNRYEICKELDIEYDIRFLEFPDKDQAMLWILKNQLGRRNLSDIQFELAIARQYELEKKVEGAPIGNVNASKQPDQNDQVNSPGETRARIAQEHNISPAKVQRSVDLGEAVKAVQEIAPDVAQKIESGEIKAPKKDIRTIGKVLQKGTPEQKEQIVSELKDNFQKAAAIANDISIRAKSPEPEPLTDEQKAALDQYVHEIATKPKVPVTWQNASHHDMLLEIGDEMTCPKCGKTARLMLKWTCCDLSIEEAQDLADEIVKQAIDVAEERFRERQRMNGKGVTSS
jgi:ribosomal protein S27AE